MNGTKISKAVDSGFENCGGRSGGAAVPCVEQNQPQFTSDEKERIITAFTEDFTKRANDIFPVNNPAILIYEDAVSPEKERSWLFCAGRLLPMTNKLAEKIYLKVRRSSDYSVRHVFSFSFCGRQLHFQEMLCGIGGTFPVVFEEDGGVILLGTEKPDSFADIDS